MWANGVMEDDDWWGGDDEEYFEQPFVILENCKILNERVLSVLCEIEGEQYWLPKSQLDVERGIGKEGEEGDLVVAEWIAMEKGII